MDAPTNRRIVARDLRRRLLVWQGLQADLWKRYQRLERLYRKAFEEADLAAPGAAPAVRIAALADALDARLGD